jgi:hypothetical protein
MQGLHCRDNTMQSKQDNVVSNVGNIIKEEHIASIKMVAVCYSETHLPDYKQVS